MAQHALAVLVDFENMARPGARSRGDFDIRLVLDRLNEKGRVIVKRAYADWSRYREAKHQLQNAGLELIEMPSAREGAKNRADIKLAVDAMELAYSREHVTNFVIVSGDSDFTPLVGKLRELDKRVTGVGNRDSSSELLIANCDEFIFYDTIAGGSRGSQPRATGDAGAMLRDTLTALQREGIEWPLASIVKDSMRRKNPAFDERDLGFSTFSKLLEDANTRGVVRLETDPRSGTYRVELGDSSAQPPEIDAGSADERGEDGPGRRRRRRRRGGEPAEASEANGGLGDLPDGAEVFEVVVSPRTEEPLGELPPVGEPISYEDVILLGGEIDAEIPELIERSDLSRLEAEQPSRGSRRRRRRFTTDEEPTAADLESLVEEGDEAPVRTAAAPFAVEPMAADAIRAALEAGEPVYFTVEDVEPTSAEALGTATLEGDEVVRAWTNAAGKSERRPSKSLDAGVKFLAAGRKGAFRAVAIVGGSIAEPEAAPAPSEVDAATPGDGGRRRRRRVSEPSAEAPVATPEAPSEATPRRRRRATPSAEAPATEDAPPVAAEAPTAEEPTTDGSDTGGGDEQSGRRRRRRTRRPAAE